MSNGPQNKTEVQPDTSKCLARSVVNALSEDPTLEAVTIDRTRKTISLATIGQANLPKLTERISSTFQRAQATQIEQNCSLLLGEGQCHSCVEPLSELQRQKILIQHDGAKTTIARVTCPTAPKFWRWRDIPWPKVVQRDVEFIEHAEELDEWKAQLVAAILCGLFGLGAFLFRSYPQAVLGYWMAYLAGSWF